MVRVLFCLRADYKAIVGTAEEGEDQQVSGRAEGVGGGGAAEWGRKRVQAGEGRHPGADGAPLAPPAAGRRGARLPGGRRRARLPQQPLRGRLQQVRLRGVPLFTQPTWTRPAGKRTRQLLLIETRKTDPSFVNLRNRENEARKSNVCFLEGD